MDISQLPCETKDRATVDDNEKQNRKHAGCSTWFFQRVGTCLVVAQHLKLEGFGFGYFFLSHFEMVGWDFRKQFFRTTRLMTNAKEFSTVLNDDT